MNENSKITYLARIFLSRNTLERMRRDMCLPALCTNQHYTGEMLHQNLSHQRTKVNSQKYKNKIWCTVDQRIPALVFCKSCQKITYERDYAWDYGIFLIGIIIGLALPRVSARTYFHIFNTPKTSVMCILAGLPQLRWANKTPAALYSYTCNVAFVFTSHSLTWFF